MIYLNIINKIMPQYLVASITTLVLFISGLHTGWPAPSLPKITSNEYIFEITSEEGSDITIIGSVGNIIGSFGSNLLLDRIGRKKLILLMALPQFISFLCYILSDQAMELLYVGRFLGGISEGSSLAICFLYIGEIAEPSIRGSLCSFGSVAIFTGILVANLVGSYLSIQITGAVFISLPVAFIIVFWKMPESPYYLVMKKRLQEAKQVLQFLRNTENIDEEFEKLSADVTRQISEPGTFKNVFTIESNRKALFLAGGARFFQTATGIAALNLYLQVLLENSTKAIDPASGASIILAVQVLVSASAKFVIDRFGRKPLLVLSSTGCCVNLILQTIYFTLEEHSSLDLSSINWFPLVMLVFHMLLYSIGLAVVVSVITSELFSASVKGKLTCLVNCVYALSTLLVTKFYQSTSEMFGLTVPFATFALCTFCSVLFFYYLLPETKGKSLEQIQQELKGNPQ